MGQLVKPAFDELGWKPQPGESPLIPQLRADLLRTLGTLGNDREVQERAVELYESRVCQGLIGLSTPELASEVDQELRKVIIDGQTLQQYLGGKTLEQILERLRIFVKLREREGKNLQEYLAACTPSVIEEVR